MQKLFLTLLSLAFVTISYSQTVKQTFISSDIDNFWVAYEKIIAASDSVEQYKYLKELYLDKGTSGLKSLIEVRNYTDRDFIDAITQYPKFWNSVRPQTLISKEIYTDIENDIKKLKKIYPALKPLPIYFSVGAFRTNGTAADNKILIGSELALANKFTVVDELPVWRQPFYKEYNPRENIGLLCAHEYIHPHQKELVRDLLSICLYEGVAEFVSCKATGKKSTLPAIEFGKANTGKVVKQFVSDLFLMSNNSNWIWGENRNDLKIRDLGYFIGYEISERYYNQAANKLKAIEELIELDYENEKEVERIVEKSRLLPNTLVNLYADYDKQRPTVISITPFRNGDDKVKSGTTQITVVFSEPLNGHNTGIDFGPLGQDFCPAIKLEKTWTKDMKSWTFEAELKPNQHYQILISNNFRMENEVRLKPYLIEFKTAE